MLSVAAAPAGEPGAVLRSRLAGFAGFLRANGYGLGGGDAATLLAAAARVGVFDGAALRWSLKALLCGRGDEWRRFDALFDAYFLPPNRKAFAERFVTAIGRPGPSGAATTCGDTLPVAGASAGGADDDGSGRHGASREESLAGADFRELHRPDQLRGIEALMRRFARRLRNLELRREARRQRGRRLDLRGTIRASIASGGTPLQLAWKDRRRVRPRLVLLLDVSRSMSAYSFFYLRLARALCAELADVHCYIFHTRLTAVAEALRDPDPWRSQERLHLLSAGWAGGTRIGECLAEFERSHATRLLHSRSAVVVVSDGYDTGEPALLGAALAALRRRARRIVWINPLVGQPGFSPVSQGMTAARPQLDALVGGADLAAIERVLPALLAALA